MSWGRPETLCYLSWEKESSEIVSKQIEDLYQEVCQAIRVQDGGPPVWRGHGLLH
jgi:hypothetical protein